MIQIIGILELFIFYIAYFIKLYYQKRNGIQTNQLGVGNKANRTIIIEKLLRLVSFIIVFIIFISAALNTSFFNNTAIRITGLLFLGAGTVIFIIAMITLKDSWRAGIPSGDKTEMVTSGIYKYSRNPAFLGFDLTYIGANLAFGNIIVFSFAILTIVMMHLQILEEEKFLESVFGQKYIQYKGKVSRYI